mmetsp:Transcript_61467/g.70476  ORF Transcript_61467/g.70476 Transcript_61467/m.70476 type:complete len:591 (-) Transcript_61467:2498-4270(-)|eukprot:CAMPEP_0115016512 /NCGR_PEP_ID=MMETSP0216-20121206/27490_1 /TAXON_ID=223996 /ORGANISM="Protocruzia adherens, Strain Boccale" /LENGTH=590 /DNA_ID=CAMNT_0002387001 /DNA_START=337 /DNA_END=2109 /DNA_ORIENTATION=-
MTEANGQAPTLYAGDLDMTVNETELRKFFGNEFAAEIISVSIMTDSETRPSSKWAYVAFKSLDSAVKALKMKNLQDLHGKPCRLMQYNTDASTRKSGKGNLFVKSIAPTVTTKELSEFFSKFGEPVSCKVEMDPSTGKSKGYGYVQFSATEDADRAINDGNGQELRGQALEIQHFQTQQERSGDLEGITVYVKSLPVEKNYSEEQIKEHFTACGDVKMVQLFRDHSGNLKGSAVVHFAVKDERAKALSLNEQEFLGSKIKVIAYKTRQQLANEKRVKGEEIERMNQERKQRNLFLKNLHPETTEADIREIFEKFGDVESVRVQKSENGPKIETKFGFVCFKNEVDADSARKKMYQRDVKGYVMFVTFAKTQVERSREQENRSQVPFSGYGMGVGGRPMGNFARYPMQYRPRPFTTNFPFYPGNYNQTFQFIPHDFLRPTAMHHPRYGGNGRGGYRGGAGHRGNAGYARGGNRNYEVSNRVRNVRPHHEQEVAAATKTTVTSGQEKATNDTTGLADMSDDEFKNYMGNQIYEEAHSLYGDRAGKITGMILDAHDRPSLVEIVQDRGSLEKAIKEAYAYLEEHTQQDEDADE